MNSTARQPENISIEVFSEGMSAEGDGICGLKLVRGKSAPEIARLHASLGAHTQRVMYHLLAENGRLYEFETSMVAIGALREGDIAIDIGAHIGYFSLLFRLLVGASGTVFAFEPMPDTYRRLLHNIIRNCFTNVLPLPLAIADQEGSAKFFFNSRNEGESSLLEIGDSPSCEVQVTNLDRMFADILPTRPRLLKIDAEGVEVLILKGGQSWFRNFGPDIIICEINRGALSSAGASEQEIIYFFVALGYKAAIINMEGTEMGMEEGKRIYRYVDHTAPLLTGFGYVFNMMFVRPESGLYPDSSL